MITLYDLGPSNFPEDFGCSPHVRKVILALNYKRLPFKVSTIEDSTIESVAKSVGAPPTATRPDGSPKYTVPFIHDSTTGKSVSDSLLISVYLDEAYPDTPKLVPEGTRVLQSVFIDTFGAKVSKILGPIFFPHFLRTISTDLRIRIGGSETLPELPPPQEQKNLWENARKGFEELLPEPVNGQSNSVFVGGEKPIFTDFALAAYLLTFKVFFGEE
ncbi:hypothetical protein L218DRAFT_900681, partial [Marasmius fiardii PR-910]